MLSERAARLTAVISPLPTYRLGFGTLLHFLVRITPFTRYQAFMRPLICRVLHHQCDRFNRLCSVLLNKRWLSVIPEFSSAELDTLRNSYYFSFPRTPHASHLSLYIYICFLFKGSFAKLFTFHLAFINPVRWLITMVNLIKVVLLLIYSVHFSSPAEFNISLIAYSLYKYLSIFAADIFAM